jgi:hypothetical protein
VAHGKSAHGGVNIEGGRNALVALARATEGLLPASGENDLLAFARLAGKDLHGTGLGLTENDPIWGRYLVNVATVKPRADGRLRLEIVLRRPPPRTGPQIRAYLEKVVAAFNAAETSLTVDGYWDDEPSFDPRRRSSSGCSPPTAATGETVPPAVAGGGTYAKRPEQHVRHVVPGRAVPRPRRRRKIPIEASRHPRAHRRARRHRLRPEDHSRSRGSFRKRVPLLSRTQRCTSRPIRVHEGFCLRALAPRRCCSPDRGSDGCAFTRQTHTCAGGLAAPLTTTMRMRRSRQEHRAGTTEIALRWHSPGNDQRVKQDLTTTNQDETSITVRVGPAGLVAA